MKKTSRTPSSRPSRKPFKKTVKKVPGRSVTVWDQAARWYDALVGVYGTDHHRDIIMPGVLKLINARKGDRILDLACGQGVFSRYLASKGMQVEGLDSSEELIQYARSRSKPSIVFHVADARKKEAFEKQRFDAAACILALQNMERLEPVFQNIAQWLKPEARFVFVITHPCFRIPRQTHWGWDEEKKIEYRRVDRYASEIEIPIITPPIASSKVFTTTYHRPLQSYLEALFQAGLGVERLEEWVSGKTSEPGKRAKAENRARKEIPLFMALCVRRLPVVTKNKSKK